MKWFKEKNIILAEFPIKGGGSNPSMKITNFSQRKNGVPNGMKHENPVTHPPMTPLPILNPNTIHSECTQICFFRIYNLIAEFLISYTIFSTTYKYLKSIKEIWKRFEKSIFFLRGWGV